MMGAPQSEKGRQEQETQPEVTNAFDDGCHFNLLFDQSDRSFKYHPQSGI